MQATFREWIKEKGAGRLASLLGLTNDAVYSWSHRNIIPRSVWPELILAFSEMGLNDFLAMEAASKQADQ